MNYDEFDNEFDDEIIFKDEIGAYLRTSVLGHNTNKNPALKLDHSLLNPLDVFKDEVEAIAWGLQSILEVHDKPINKKIMLNEEDIQILITSADKLEYVNYKNPTAYILGFLVTKDHAEINPKSFEYVTKHVLKLLQDSSVLPPDIIRYARLWVLHLIK